MKKSNSRTNSTKTKAVLFAGAATLALAATSSRAQSSDALIDKLVDKGILSTKEAQDLREESDNDFKTAFQAKTGMPDWVTGYSLNGSFRGRFEQFSGDNAAAIDRTRLRYRILVGLKVNMLDDLEAGFRLGSGDPKGSDVGANPLSRNSTMQDDFSEKGIYIDQAYGKWTPIHSGNWLFSATVGKMENPFQFTPMVFDPDLTPEGAAFQGGYTINDKHAIAFTGAAFVLDEEAGTTRDPFMYGGQVLWNAKWTSKWSSSLGLGAFSIANPQALTPANVAEINQGNTRVGAAGVLKYNYDPIIADASVTYALDSFPLYPGAFPIKLQGEFIVNPGAASNVNKAYWAGIQFGKSGTKKTWDLSYRYEYLENDAWYDQMVDDDNVAYYQAAPGGGGSTGFVGGTDIKGHLVKLNYSFTDSLTFSATCFVNDLINSQVNGVNEPKSGDIHFFADLMWKF
jgi:hypothetical protein